MLGHRYYFSRIYGPLGLKKGVHHVHHSPTFPYFAGPGDNNLGIREVK